MQLSVILSDFTPMRLSKEVPQAALLEETTRTFGLAQCALQRPASQAATERILARTRRLVERYGVSPAYISQRETNTLVSVKTTAGGDHSYVSIIPQPAQQPHGLPLDRRMEEFRAAASRLLEQHYADCKEPPDDLIHVTCTGYMSPSPVQQLVARRQWYDTVITHCYHMGCSGAFSAVRIAHGFMGASFALQRPKTRIDLFHTEYVSLHADACRLSPSNIISVTLFGDGFIHYSAFSPNSFDFGRKNGLKILALDERIIPDSEQEMTWDLGPNHFDMTLSPAVPSFVAEHIEGFVADLVAMAGYRLDDIKGELIFAIHPGGSKVLDYIQNSLRITREQMHYSWQVLYEKGNMSSVTVPYIWHAIVEDDRIPAGRLVLSLAFGPGLTACGILLEKV